MQAFGRVPYYPSSAVESLSHAGPMTRTVQDAALMMNVIAGPDERDRNTLPPSDTDYLAALYGDTRNLKIAWSVDLGYANVDPEVARLTEEAAQAFSTLGCHVEDVSLNLEDPIHIFNTLWLGGFWAALGDDLEEWGDRMDPGLVRFIQQGKNISTESFGYDGYMFKS